MPIPINLNLAKLRGVETHEVFEQQLSRKLRLCM